jgi:hypothetical protein
MAWTAPLLTAALLVSSPAFGQDRSAIDTVLDNIAAEYATCAAYYRLVYHGAAASNRKDVATSYRQLEDDAMFYSLLLASEGRDADMAIQVTNARIESGMKAMKKEIGNRNENLAILINKHGETCVAMSKKPPAAAQKVLEKRLNEAAAEEKK